MNETFKIEGRKLGGKKHQPVKYSEVWLGLDLLAGRAVHLTVSSLNMVAAIHRRARYTLNLYPHFNELVNNRNKNDLKCVSLRR